MGFNMQKNRLMAGSVIIKTDAKGETVEKNPLIKLPSFLENIFPVVRDQTSTEPFVLPNKRFVRAKGPTMTRVHGVSEARFSTQCNKERTKLASITDNTNTTDDKDSATTVVKLPEETHILRQTRLFSRCR